ncbi:MAG: TrkA family potassium uptake protein [Thermanaerothrix sp.]|nr:TrkA family potassium uptake protein [Thermanaerothrix sp.]
MDHRCTGKRRIAVIGLTLLLLIGAGMAVMHFNMGLSWVDAAFYTVTTLATVGFEAPPGLTPGSKVFLVFLIVIGFGVMAYSIGEITRFFIEDQMLTLLGRRRNKMLNSVKDHWIICGLGRVGSQVASQFHEEGIPFVALERDEQAVMDAVEGGWLVLNRNATEERALEEAGITRAKGLIATLSSDPDNVYVVLCARALNKNLRIIARANDNQSSAALYRAGADKVINPLVAGAHTMANVATRPKAAEAMQDLIYTTRRLNLEFDKVVIADDSPVAGMTLAQADLRRSLDVLVLAVRKGTAIRYNPPGDYILDGGDELLVLCLKDHVRDLRRLLTGQV